MKKLEAIIATIIALISMGVLLMVFFGNMMSDSQTPDAWWQIIISAIIALWAMIWAYNRWSET